MVPMASNQILMVLAIALAVLPASTMAAEFVVGDYQGWDPDVNYTAWAENKEFRVGDTLVFNYAQGDHNVVKIGGPDDFNACRVPKGSQVLESGKDAITLAKAGKKWYICGKIGHCDAGQKLVITVLPAITVRPGSQLPASPPPAPPPASSSTTVMISTFRILMPAASAVFMLISIQA